MRRKAGEGGLGGRLGREGEEEGWGGRVRRKAGEGEVLTCSQSRGTIVVFQLGDPPHQEFWRLQYPVCVCIYIHVCITVMHSTSDIMPPPPPPPPGTGR